MIDLDGIEYCAERGCNRPLVLVETAIDRGRKAKTALDKCAENEGKGDLSAALAAILKGMTNLMVTEGDRRRARVELERQARAAKTGSVSWIDQARRSG